MELMNHRFLLKTEKETELLTVRDRKYWADEYPSLINSLFEMLYFTGDGTKLKEFDAKFFTYAYNTYQTVPYTFNSINRLMNSGYYLESMILTRTIYEMFVKLRYFSIYKEKCQDYTLGKIKITYKTMFEHFSKGLYDLHYSKILSVFAHGGFGIGIYRNRLIPPNTFEPILGNIYNESFCNWTINNTTPILLGYLNLIPLVFKEYMGLATIEVKQLRLNNIKWLENCIDNYLLHNPNKNKFYDLMNPLIR